MLSVPRREKEKPKFELMNTLLSRIPQKLHKGVPTASGQKPTLSRYGIGPSQRAKPFAMEFPFDAYRRTCDPNGVFHNNFVAALLAGTIQ